MKLMRVIAVVLLDTLKARFEEEHSEYEIEYSRLGGFKGGRRR